jgi:hypothetical protein
MIAASFKVFLIHGLNNTRKLIMRWFSSGLLPLGFDPVTSDYDLLQSRPTLYPYSNTDITSIVDSKGF